MLSHAARSAQVEKHEGVWVVRDDLLPGGTKSRIFKRLMELKTEAEFVYAGPAIGLAQVALAVAAYQACRQATIFVAKRAERSFRTKQAHDFGAKIVEVAPGYLSVVQARAALYAHERGAYLVPFGGADDCATLAIAEAARSLDVAPSNVWCAAGSGTVARALRTAWPEAELNAVEVGKRVSFDGSIVTHPTTYHYAQPCRSAPPFSADRFYEAKAWEVMTAMPNASARNTLFWNVAGFD